MKNKLLFLLILFIPFIVKAADYTCFYNGCRNGFYVDVTNNSTSAQSLKIRLVDSSIKVGDNTINLTTFNNNSCPNIYSKMADRDTCDFSSNVAVGWTLSTGSIYTGNTGGNTTGGNNPSGSGNTPTPTPSTPSNNGNSSTGTGSTNTYLDYTSLCSNSTEGNKGIKQAVKIVGIIISFMKWIVPGILIVVGMIDFAKAVISSDDKAISKSTASFVKRLVAAVIIFFIPTIALTILDVLKVTNGIEKTTDTNFGACTKCLFDPFNSCN